MEVRLDADSLHDQILGKPRVELCADCLSQITSLKCISYSKIQRNVITHSYNNSMIKT